MNEHVDEEIGALLDGRLDLRRRTELLARLSTDDADYDVFADTAAVLREAEGGEMAANESAEVREEVRETAVIPLRPRRASGWRSPAVRSLAAAAVLATTVLVPVVRMRMVADRWRDPARLAALATTLGEPLPPGWIDAVPWGGKRGADIPSEETRVSARVGARSTDLVVSAHAGDTVAVPRIANDIAFTLENVSAGPVAERYRQIADSAAWSRPKVLKQVTEANDDLASTVDRDYFALGAWTEAARLAASRRDAAFFSARESRKAVERAGALEGLSDDGKAAVAYLRSVQEQGGIPAWTVLEEKLAALLRGLAN